MNPSVCTMKDIVDKFFEFKGSLLFHNETG